MEVPDARLGEGIALFNQGDYYACHDVLEAIWMESPTSGKNFYQGILQIAVGLYHLDNHNWQGASILLGEGVNRLRPFEPSYAGVDVEQLVDCGWAWLTALHGTGRDRVAEVAALIPRSQGNRSQGTLAPGSEPGAVIIIGTAMGEDQPIALPTLHIVPHPHQT